MRTQAGYLLTPCLGGVELFPGRHALRSGFLSRQEPFSHLLPGEGTLGVLSLPTTAFCLKLADRRVALSGLRLLLEGLDLLRQPGVSLGDGLRQGLVNDGLSTVDGLTLGFRPGSNLLGLLTT